MKIHTTALFVLVIVVLAVAAGAALGGCYDVNKVPPCDPKVPNPTLGCFDAPRDAGHDG